jgi:hypothetical protein
LKAARNQKKFQLLFWVVCFFLIAVLLGIFFGIGYVIHNK